MSAILLIEILLGLLALSWLNIIILIRRVRSLEQYAADCRIAAVVDGEVDRVTKMRGSGL